jgi:hypothetical protein
MSKTVMIVLAVSLLLAACTPYMYGVPQETWDQMSEPERIEAMAIYEREQQANRQAAAERARQQAMERERERARQAEMARARQERIEAIHRGDGAYGELLRVRLQGGRIKIGDQNFRYEPLTFTIADGEAREIIVAAPKKRATPLVASYGGGSLSFDGTRFPYERSWGKGKLYTDTGSSGALKMRGVDVFIEVHNRSSRHDREPLRLVISREEPPPSPGPQPVIVSEPVKPAPPPGRQPAPAAAELPPRIVEVALLSAEMKVQGQNQPVEKATLRLVEGETRKLAVKAGSAANELSLRYRKGELFIDNGPAKGRDAYRLPFEKEWKSGKIYHFELKGKVPLEKAVLKITGIEGK